MCRGNIPVNCLLRVYNPFINGVIQHVHCLYNIQRQFVGTKPITNFRLFLIDDIYRYGVSHIAKQSGVISIH